MCDCECKYKHTPEPERSSWECAGTLHNWLTSLEEWTKGVTDICLLGEDCKLAYLLSVSETICLNVVAIWKMAHSNFFIPVTCNHKTSRIVNENLYKQQKLNIMERQQTKKTNTISSSIEEWPRNRLSVSERSGKAYLCREHITLWHSDAAYCKCTTKRRNTKS